MIQGGSPGHAAPPASGGSAGAGIIADPETRDDACNPPEARIWRLTPVQLERTWASVFSGVSGVASELDDSFVRGQGFSNEAGLLQMPEPHVGALFAVAKRTAESLANTPAALDPCLAEATVTDACVEGVLVGTGGKLVRGALSEAERTSYASLYRAQHDLYGPAVALRQVLSALLLSPRSLYRYELGPEGAAPGQAMVLTPTEKASALSYWLSDGPPDEALMAAAESGALDQPSSLEAEVRRLLSADRAMGIQQFFEEYLRIEGVVHKNPDSAAFPDFDRGLLQAMADESRAFVSHSLFTGGARFETLLTADFTLASPELAAHYGTSAAAPGMTTLLPPPRAGFLTQGSFLAQWALGRQTDIVRRGKFVREVLLCQSLPPPPDDVDVVPPDVPEGSQQREALTAHSSKAECAGCHSLMDPIGLVFEQFDAVGAYRELEAGRAIDTTSTIPQVDGGELTVSGPRDLAQQLARSPEAQACFVATAYRYAHGRAASGRDRCALDAVGQAFGAAQGDMLQSVIAIVGADNFFQRIAP